MFYLKKNRLTPRQLLGYKIKRIYKIAPTRSWNPSILGGFSLSAKSFHEGEGVF